MAWSSFSIELTSLSAPSAVPLLEASYEGEVGGPDCGVGRAVSAGVLVGEALECVQQRVVFARAALVGVNHVAGLLGVGVGLVDSGLLSAEVFAGNQAA